MAFQRSLARLKMSPHFKTLEKFLNDDKQLEIDFGNRVTSVGREDIRQICKYLGLNFISRGQGSQKKIYALKLDRIRGRKRVDQIVNSVPKGVANFYEAVCTLLPEHKSKIEDWFAQFLGGHTEALSSRHLRGEDEITLKGGIGAAGGARPKAKAANFRGGIVGFGEEAEEVERKRKEAEEKKRLEKEKKAKEEADKLKELKQEQKKLKKEAKKEVKKAKKEEKKIKKKQWKEKLKEAAKEQKKNAPKRAMEKEEEAEAKKRKKQEPELEEAEDDEEESSDADFKEEVWENVPEQILPPIEIVHDDSFAEDYCDLIRDVYADKNPSKTDEEIDDLLEKYGDKLQNLYLSVCDKYGVDPDKHQREFERRREDEGDDIFAQLAKQDKALLGTAAIGVSSDEEAVDDDYGEADVFFDQYAADIAKNSRKGKGKGKEKNLDKGKEKSWEDRRKENPKEVCVAGFGEETTQQDLETFFKAQGVRGIENVRYLDRARPLCFFTFETEEQAERAIEKVNGKRLKENELYVQLAKATQKVGAGFSGANPRQIYMSGVRDVEEDTIKKFFSRHSSHCHVEWIKILHDEDGNRKNDCFVTFSTERGAQKALELDGDYMGDLKLRIQMARGRRTGGPQAPQPRRMPRERKDWSKDAASREGLTGLKHLRDDL